MPASLPSPGTLSEPSIFPRNANSGVVVNASVTPPLTTPENKSTVPDSRIVNPVVQSISAFTINFIWSKFAGAPVTAKESPFPETDISP